MTAIATRQPNARTVLRLVWGMLIACLLASSLPAMAANGRNPSCVKAARAAAVAKAASQVAQAPVQSVKPSAQR
jgi:hypothetical protein